MSNRASRHKKSGLISFMNLSLYLGVVVVLSIGAGYRIGRALDEWLSFNNVFTILFLIIGCGVAFYIIIRRLMDIGQG